MPEFYRIKNRNTILPDKFSKIDADRISIDLTASEKNGWIYFVIEGDDI